MITDDERKAIEDAHNADMTEYVGRTFVHDSNLWTVRNKTKMGNGHLGSWWCDYHKPNETIPYGQYFQRRDLENLLLDVEGMFFMIDGHLFQVERYASSMRMWRTVKVREDRKIGVAVDRKAMDDILKKKAEQETDPLRFISVNESMPVLEKLLADGKLSYIERCALDSQLSMWREGNEKARMLMHTIRQLGAPARMVKMDRNSDKKKEQKLFKQMWDMYVYTHSTIYMPADESYEDYVFRCLGVVNRMGKRKSAFKSLCEETLEMGCDYLIVRVIGERRLQRT